MSADEHKPNQKSPPPGSPREPRSGSLDEEATQALPLDALGLTPPAGQPAPQKIGDVDTINLEQESSGSGETMVEKTARWEPPSAPSAGGQAEPTRVLLPVDPDDEPELPYSLQPADGGNESTPMVSRSVSRSRRPHRKGLWLGVGALVGLSFAAWLYFRPWPVNPAIYPPQRDEGQRIENPQGEQPVTQWYQVDAMLIGANQFNEPWIFEPASHQTLTATLSLPREMDWNRLALVSRPPLDPATRLTWIEGSGAANRLVCRDYDFRPPAEAEQGSAGLGAGRINWSAPLAGTDFDFPPTVVDHPDPAVGLRLVATDRQGALSAWNPQASPEDGPVWETQLPAPPAAPPLAWLDRRSDTGRLWLIAVTLKGVVVIDSADGQVKNQADWPQPLAEGGRMDLVPMRLGEVGWGWVASDGRQVAQWRLDPDGKVLMGWTGELPALRSNGGAPRLLAFPDPDAPAYDQFAVTTDAGETAWINHAMQTAGPLPAQMMTTEVTGPLAALDLNGDGYWDLTGIGEQGYLWYRPGPATAQWPGERIPWGNQIPSPVASPVFWRIGDEKLIVAYIDNRGTVQEIGIPLPALTRSHAAALREDWRRRQAGG